MTLDEAIALCDELKPNDYARAHKLRWLSDAEGLIYEEVVRPRLKTPAGIARFEADTPGDTELLASGPYEDLYVKYLMAQVDFANAEFGRYNNAAMLFNAAFGAFSAWYGRRRRVAHTSHVRLEGQV